MTAKHSTVPTLLVAIDISKHRHEVLIAIPGKRRRRRLTVMNTLEEFQRLGAALTSYDLPVRIGFEATGNYHRTLAHHLGRAGLELKLVSSVGLARTREALHNSWDKNDPKDAQVILHILEIGAIQFFDDPLVTGTADIQELSKTHEIVSRSKTELWHCILTHYLPLYFPEADRFHRSSRSDWFLTFLEKYPTPHMITAMSRDAFISDAWAVVGRKVSKERLLSDIYATAVGSVGLPNHPDSDTVRMFRLVLTEGRSLIRKRDEIEARAVKLLSDLSDYPLLTTIPGIGPINAMTILADAGNLRRFRHHRQFLKFAEWTSPPSSPACFAVKAGSRSMAMGGFGAHPEWPARPLCCRRLTVSATSSNATSQRTGKMPVCIARPKPRSRPRWRAPYTPSSSTANPIVPSSKG